MYLHLSGKEIMSLKWASNNNKQEPGIVSSIIWKKWDWEKLKDDYEKWIMELDYILGFLTLKPSTSYNI